MELKQIEYFLHLAESEHMSQTADMLNVAQPTLSRSISALEKELGIKLFDRVGNRLHLNRSGEQFYQYAREALELLHTANLSARQSMYETTGSVCIHCTTFSAILLPCIRDYMQLNPRVDIKLNQYSQIHGEEAVSDACDLILTCKSEEFEQNKGEQFWVEQPLFEESNDLVIGPRHARYKELSAAGDIIDLTTLKEELFITMDFGRTFRDITYSLCQKAGFFPKSSFQTDDFVAKMHAVREGAGIAFLPESCLEEASLLCPGLRHFSIKGIESRRTVLLLRKKRNLLSETALDFWDFVLEQYRLPADERD